MPDWMNEMVRKNLISEITEKEQDEYEEYKAKQDEY